jgi:hypothetical protein
MKFCFSLAHTAWRLNHLGKFDLAEELSGQYEGDMVLSPDEIDVLLGKKGAKTALINKNMYWPDNIVPYIIRSADFSKFFFCLILI